VAPLVAALDRVSALAEGWPGKARAVAGREREFDGLQPTSDSLFIVNMSVWGDAEALFSFV
jgi:hypothetical protein